MNPPEHVVLSLHQPKETLLLGEPVFVQLQVSNASRQTQVFGGFVFDHEHFAFAAPNEVNLVAPDGLDLAAAYRSDVSYFRSHPALEVAPGEDTWLRLPIHAHLQLLTLGRYAFGLALADDNGGLSRSNRVEFDVVDEMPDTMQQSIRLLIEPSSEVVSAEALRTQAAQLLVTFANISQRTVVVLRPQDDSGAGWVNPVFRVIVTDAAGRQLAHSPRCGTMAAPTYDAASTIRLLPGDTAQLRLPYPLVESMWRRDEYSVRLLYLVRDRAIGKGGTVLEQPMGWEPEVLVGHVVSNEIALRVVE